MCPEHMRWGLCVDCHVFHLSPSLPPSLPPSTGSSVSYISDCEAQGAIIPSPWSEVAWLSLCAVGAKACLQSGQVFLVLMLIHFEHVSGIHSCGTVGTWDMDALVQQSCKGATEKYGGIKPVFD
uniref:Uncharacterized protein n=1 Tax=Sphaerodactylus townsendi TaxID=933632 RepID=A0ACB8FAE5_9SAUR